jgi:hypothetical protein
MVNGPAELSIIFRKKAKKKLRFLSKYWMVLENDLSGTCIACNFMKSEAAKLTSFSRSGGRNPEQKRLPGVRRDPHRMTPHEKRW